MRDPSCLRSGGVVFVFPFIVFALPFIVFAFLPLAANPHGHWFFGPTSPSTFFLPSCYQEEPVDINREIQNADQQKKSARDDSPV